jgi:glutamate synthase domain-containing protein 2/formate hydrogenlyase subunit 6/NADH:ubiquinone oxidoreductase subunit I
VSFSVQEDKLKQILPKSTLRTRVPQQPVVREVNQAEPRFRNEISKYILRRNNDCIMCGKCVEVCPQGVHIMKRGYKLFAASKDQLCLGPDCQKTDHYCIDLCPQGALQLTENPEMKMLGTKRWTADLILATWKMARTGQQPPEIYEYRHGDSGGGFDRIRFKFPDKPPVELKEDEIDTSIELNRRDDGRPKIRIDVPWYCGGMSFGAIGVAVQVARARAAMAWNTFGCTGEGGYPELLRPYDDHMITQIATGLFGVREETIQRVPIVEFKYAQGAKPGLGGHLLGDKNTPDVARMRGALPGTSLFSPFPFHSVYSIEDHKKHIDWVKHINRRALVSSKVSTPTDVDMVAIGSYHAGTHIVHLDGGYGGTGAAPDIAKKNIAMPIEYAITRVHRFLEEEGVRDKVTLIVSGGLRSAFDVAKAIAFGADGIVTGTVELVALGCVQCGRCESGRGCPRGIATTDTVLREKITVEWATQRLINLHNAWRLQLVDVLRRFGMRSVAELRGRTDLLMHLDYNNDLEPQE